MHLSENNTATTPDTFIQQTCSKAAGQQAQHFEQLFADCAAQPPDATEVVMLSGFMPLLAMSLAQLHKDVQRGYALAFSEHLKETRGHDAGTLFPQRTLEYLAAFQQDVTTAQAGTLPALLSAALQHICGVSDDSVLACRPELLQALIPTLRADVERFGGLRFTGV